MVDSCRNCEEITHVGIPETHSSVGSKPPVRPHGRSCYTVPPVPFWLGELNVHIPCWKHLGILASNNKLEGPDGRFAQFKSQVQMVVFAFATLHLARRVRLSLRHLLGLLG